MTELEITIGVDTELEIIIGVDFFENFEIRLLKCKSGIINSLNSITLLSLLVLMLTCHCSLLNARNAHHN